MTTHNPCNWVQESFLCRTSLFLVLPAWALHPERSSPRDAKTVEEEHLWKWLLLIASNTKSGGSIFHLGHKFLREGLRMYTTISTHNVFGYVAVGSYHHAFKYHPNSFLVLATRTTLCTFSDWPSLITLLYIRIMFCFFFCS